jgi:hypothetical protein
MMMPNPKAHLYLHKGLDRTDLRMMAMLLYGQSQMHFPTR